MLRGKNDEDTEPISTSKLSLFLISKILLRGIDFLLS